MIDRVLGALCDSRVDRIHPVTSPHAPETRSHLANLLDGDGPRPGFATSADPDPDPNPDLADSLDFDRPTDTVRSTAITIVDAPGEGYVSDLGYALDRVSSPTLTVACDLPLLAPAAIDRVLDRTEGSRGSLAVYVPAALKRRLGVSTDTTWTHGGRELAPTGLNVVAQVRDEHETTETAHDRDRSMADADTTTDIDTDAAERPTATDDPSADEPGETTYVTHDARLAVNVNRPSDLTVAEALCE